MREGKQVSHKQLSVCSLGVQTTNPVTQQLWSQIYNFQRGCLFAKEQLAIKSPSRNVLLQKVHQILAPEVGNHGEYRTSPCWIGGKSPDTARFVAADANRIHSLMQDWYNALDQQPPTSLEHALSLYDQFLVVHPFNDGNGRVARAFLDGALSHVRNNYWLHPLFFRLANSSVQYENKHNAYQRDDIVSWLNYWETAFRWLEQKQRQIAQALSECEQQFRLALACCMKPKGWEELVQQLYDTPIINMQTAHHYVEAATVMLQTGLLEVKTLSNANNTKVLECPYIFKLWQCWEDILLASEDIIDKRVAN
ncbi:Fic family protein [Pseudoalteromonas sp. S16_S37]|uniref:Fic family protein n=1 Tax=Pseudoalteromonas sp. S16_S37 TaxID=2720228 RepID=UPI00167FE46C|nr:Fic family protein [Pseudoalteromonas sp. S16_S37]MBD1583172.1 Fic family protein [Pseudoalteromonas sp. S16_S37]